MHQLTGMWLNPNSRGSRLRIWQPWGCNSLHAHQPSLEAQQERGCRAEARSAQAGFTARARSSFGSASHFRRLASAGIADPGDLKSPSLPGASPGSPTSLRSKRSKSEAAAPKHAVRRRASLSTQASFGPAGHFAAAGFSGNSRPRRLKIAEPSGCKSRVRRPAYGSPGIAARFGASPNRLGSASLITPTILESQPDERTGPVC